MGTDQERNDPLSHLQTAGSLIAGFGESDITPWMGVHLAGAAFGEYRPASFVRHRLYAKAAVFESNKTVCIIGLDTISITQHYADMIKAAVSEKTNIPTDHIAVFAIQSHSAPAVGHLMLDEDFPIPCPEDKEYITGSSRDYSEFAANRAIEAALSAFETRRPMQMDVKSGLAHGLAFCRRFIMRDGSLAMFPPKKAVGTREEESLYPDPGDANLLGPDILYAEDPVDEELGVVCFRDSDMSIAGALLHFTCHPVCDYLTPALYRAVSADWCGTFSEALQQKLRIGSVPMVLNGCCGNINPFDPYPGGKGMDSEQMGEALAKVAEHAAFSMPFADADTPLSIDVRTFTVPIDYRDIPGERVAEVTEKMATGTIPFGPDGRVDDDWFLAASTYSAMLAKEREPQFSYPVQIFKIGALAIIALAGEPFTNGQLDIKLRSKAAFTYVTHMSNKYIGYLAHREGYQFDGHETNFHYTNWAKVAPGSLEKICDRVVEELNAMFDPA